MWWLTYSHGGAVVVEAPSLGFAQALVALRRLGQASHFVDGHLINPERAAVIPSDCISRMLSQFEARRLRWNMAVGEMQARTSIEGQR
jgi:hypothetical protein